MKNIIYFMRVHWQIFWIILVWLLFASPYFLKGLVPFPSKYLVTFFSPWNASNGMPVKNNAMPDVITQLYPWKKLVIESWKLGQIPRWNPYQFSGTPLLANVQSAVFSPFNILFFILPFIDAWSILILLQPLLAGLFMFALLRQYGVSKSGSLISGISFMFCGFITVWMAYGTLGYAILYLPLILLALEQVRIRMDKRSAILLVGSIVLSIFSGHLQTSVYVIGTTILYIIFQSILRKDVAFFFRSCGLLLVGLLIGSLQIFPSLHFYRQAVRSELFQKGEVIPWNYLPTVIAPDFFGNPVTRNDWFGHYAEWASFAGVIPLILAIYLMFMKRNRAIIYFYGLLGFAAILAAYDTPVVDIMVKLHIPVLSTSAFSRVIVLWSFVIAVLAGFGFDALSQTWHHQKSYRLSVYYSICWLGVLIGIWALLLSGNLMYVADATAQKLSVAIRNFIFPSVLVVVSLFCIVLGYTWKRSGRTVILVILLLLTSLDMLRFAKKWVPFDPKEFVYPQVPVLTYLETRATRSRVFGNFGNEAQSVFHLQGLEGYDPLYIRRYGEFIAAAADGQLHPTARSTVLLDKQGMYTKRALDLLGVRYFLYAKGDEKNVWTFPFWKYPESFGAPIYGDDHFEIYENSTVLPRAFIVHDYVVLASDKEILRQLFQNNLDISKKIILEEEPEQMDRSNPTRITPNEGEKVNIVAYSPNNVIMRVTAENKGLLFFSDAYYPGWSAYVNGKKTKIYRADYAFRAVVVPKGQSEVRFTYEDWFL